MEKFKTEQETFWAGEFGKEYIKRNQGDNILASNLSLFSKALKNTQPIKDIIEFGANVGMNLQALKLLIPSIKIDAIEINKEACKKLEKVIERIYLISQY
jgi:spore coat polysaccharide biosynthesis protein SpsF